MGTLAIASVLLVLLLVLLAGGVWIAIALAVSTTAAAISDTVNRSAPPANWLTQIGPTICPVANDVIIAAMRPVGFGAATSFASCMLAIAVTMNVPPTNSADAMMPPIEVHHNGNATPNAITR